jgi:2-dehydropantoate 2-reductase
MTVADTAAVLGPGRTLGAVIEIAGNMFTPGVVDRQVGRSGTWFALGAPDPAARDRWRRWPRHWRTPAASTSPTTSSRPSG